MVDLNETAAELINFVFQEKADGASVMILLKQKYEGFCFELTFRALTDEEQMPQAEDTIQ